MLMDAVGDPSHGFLLDGFPRTITQAEALGEQLAAADTALTAVILIDVPDDLIVDRISGRFACPQGHVYDLRSRSGRNGVCEHDGEPLRRRDDDTPDIVRRRLTVHREQTAPLEDFYAQQRLLLRIDGSQPPDDVFDSVRVALAQPLNATSPPGSLPQECEP